MGLVRKIQPNDTLIVSGADKKLLAEITFRRNRSGGGLWVYCYPLTDIRIIHTRASSCVDQRTTATARCGREQRSTANESP